tara:strand:- start:1599 stop:2243 length:645 start_codon:yes stop_codon:yes gene_type:complete
MGQTKELFINLQEEHPPQRPSGHQTKPDRKVTKQSIMDLSKIQQMLKAPKGQLNKFGNYKYRSCEDILSAVKPLLNGASLVISDEVVLIGDRYYIKATATLSDGKDTIQATAYAREPESRKGMDDSQLSGSASSYARKYALAGLLAIDSGEPDADTMPPPPENGKAKLPLLTPTHKSWAKAKTAIEQGKVTIEQIKKKYNLTAKNQTLLCENSK